MARLNYDHPTYITRQMLFAGVTMPGAGGVSTPMAFPVPVRLRQVSAVVATPGASGKAALDVVVMDGKSATPVGSLVLGTSPEGTVFHTRDLNVLVPVGMAIAVRNGQDSKAAAGVTVHYHVDPSAEFDPEQK